MTLVVAHQAIQILTIQSCHTTNAHHTLLLLDSQLNLHGRRRTIQALQGQSDMHKPLVLTYSMYPKHSTSQPLISIRAPHKRYRVR
jgi:hypothetical protein